MTTNRNPRVPRTFADVIRYARLPLPPSYPIDECAKVPFSLNGRVVKALARTSVVYRTVGDPEEADEPKGPKSRKPVMLPRRIRGGRRGRARISRVVHVYVERVDMMRALWGRGELFRFVVAHEAAHVWQAIDGDQSLISAPHGEEFRRRAEALGAAHSVATACAPPMYLWEAEPELYALVFERHRQMRAARASTRRRRW